MNTSKSYGEPRGTAVAPRLTVSWFALARLGIALLFLYSPFQLYLNVDGAPFATGYLIIVSLVFLLVLIVAQREGRFYISRLFPPLGLIAASVALASLRAAYPSEAVVKILHLSLQILFYLVVINVIDNELMLSRIVRFTLLGGFLSAALGVSLYFLINVAGLWEIADFMAHRVSDILYGARATEFFAGGDFYSWIRPLPGLSDYDFRATSLFVSPGENALYSCLIFFVALPLYRSLFRKHRTLQLLILVVLLFNIMVSQVRAVWLGLAVGILYYLFRSGALLNPRRLAILLSGLVLASVLAFVAAGPGSLAWHVESIFVGEDSSARSRIMTMQQGVEIVSQETPVIGVGPGNVRAALGLRSDFAGGTTHSMYLDVAVAIGGLGLLAYSWLMFRSFSAARFVNHRSPSVFLQDISLGFEVAWISLLVIQVFQGNLFGNPKSNIMWWGVIGLISVAARLTRRFPQDSGKGIE